MQCNKNIKIIFINSYYNYCGHFRIIYGDRAKRIYNIILSIN